MSSDLIVTAALLPDEINPSIPPSDSPSAYGSPAEVALEALQEMGSFPSTPLTDHDITDLLAFSRDKSGVTDKIFRKQKYPIARTILHVDGERYVLFTSCKSNGDRCLGQGRFKKAKLALNLETGQVKAVLVSRKGDMDPQEWESTQEEIRFFKDLKGKPGIAQLEASFVTDDKCYLIFDLCEQGDLLSAFDEDEPFLEILLPRLYVALDCTVGLQHIHDAGLVHRNIKPNNILLTQDASRVRAQITSLNTAAVYDDQDDPVLELVLGTAMYFSPEKAKLALQGKGPHNKGGSTRANDIWGLGIVLFQMFSLSRSCLECHTPTIALSEDDPNYGLAIHVNIIHKVAGLTQAGLTQEIEDSDVHPAIKPLLHRMLRLDPSERPTAAEVGEEIRRIGRLSNVVAVLTSPEETETQHPLTDKEAWEIIQYSEAHAEEAGIFRKDDSHLARTVLHSGGRRYALFTSNKRLGDKVFGSGASKTTKLAVDLETGRTRAVCVCRKENVTEEAWDDLLEEAEFLKTFQGQDRIIQLETIFMDNQKCYLVMDLCGEGDLFTALFEQGPVSYDFSTRFQLARDVVSGVRALHEEEVVHRDLKPENIFLLGENGVLRAKVGDLGSAVRVDDEEGLMYIAGTRAWLSPERAKAVIDDAAEDPATLASDVWAVGEILFYLLQEKRKMFGFHCQDSEDAALAMIVDFTQNDIDTIIDMAEIPDSLKPLVKGMLQIDPTKRPTMQEVSEMLEKIGSHLVS